MVKFKDFSRPLSVFPVLSKANLTFKDFSRQSHIFKYFSSLCEPCCKSTYFWASSMPRFQFISMSKYDKVACLSNENSEQLGYLSSFVSLPLALWEDSKPIVSSDRLIRLDGSTGSFKSMLGTQADLIFGHYSLLSCQPRMTVAPWIVYKDIRDYI